MQIASHPLSLNSPGTPAEGYADEAQRAPRPLARALAAQLLGRQTEAGGNPRLLASVAEHASNPPAVASQAMAWASADDTGAPPAQEEDHLAQVLDDIFEQLNDGGGGNADAADTYANDDLLRDLVEMFAHRERPIGEKQLGQQGDFDNADNPFAGALFALWNNEGPVARTGDLLALQRLLALLAMSTLARLLCIDDDGPARYRSEDEDLLLEIARFMDQHPAHYGCALDAQGQPLCWVDRIATGTPLTPRETPLFEAALAQLELTLRRFAGLVAPVRWRALRRREEVEYHLSITDTARNLLRLLCR